MSKDILDYQEEPGSFRSTLLRIILILGVLLGLAIFGLEAGLSRLPATGNWLRQLQLAAELFLVWLAINTGIRSAERLLKNLPVGWLFLAGLGISLLSHIVEVLGGWLAIRLSEPAASGWPFYLVAGLIPRLAVGLLVSVLAIITLRVESRLLAMVLRLLLIALLAFIIYFLL